MGEDKEKEMYINTCLEEYKTLREEVRQASVNMFLSFSIGLGTIAVIAIAGINVFINNNLPSLGKQFFLLSIFCIILPLLLGLITALWIGELARFKRAGDYICFIEKKLSMLLEEFYKNNIEEKWNSIQRKIEKGLNISENSSNIGRPLQWETWLRSFKEGRFFSISGHMPWIYAIRLVILLSSFTLIWIVGVNFYITIFPDIKNNYFHALIVISLIMSALLYSYLMLIGMKLGRKQTVN